MGRYCNNEDEHRSDARRDFSYRGASGYDREYYDRYSDDECKRAYTNEFDRAKREEYSRQERMEEERSLEENEFRRHRAQSYEEDYPYPEEGMPPSHYIPQEYDPNDDLPF